MQKNNTIPIAKPLIGKEEINEVIKVLKSQELTQGRWVEQFEKEFAKYINTKYAIAASNGTTALHMALLGLGIRPGDEVITTPFTFVASVNSILYVGAKPVFVDIDPSTFNMNPDLIEEKITSRTRAILPVHLFGLPADMVKINKIAKKNNLFVIEDAAQAHGAKIGSKFAGSFGDLATFSFYPTKNITTGEGGMVTTNSHSLSEKLKLIRNHGMEKRYHHNALGYNFRMTNIQAAIGICQLEKLNKFNYSRINNAKFLTKLLSPLAQIQTPFIPENLTHIFHQYTILVGGKNGNREKLAEYLRINGISTMVYYPVPIHKLKFLKMYYKNLKFPVSEITSKRVLSLPIHPSVKRAQLEKIAYFIKKFFCS